MRQLENFRVGQAQEHGERIQSRISQFFRCACKAEPDLYFPQQNKKRKKQRSIPDSGPQRRQNRREGEPAEKQQRKRPFAEQVSNVPPECGAAHLTRKIFLVHRAGERNAHGVNHLVRQCFGGVISQTALLADEAAVQKNERKKVVRFQLNSGGKKTGLAGGVPSGNPAGAETEFFPGQFLRFLAEGRGDFRRIRNQILKNRVGRKHVQILLKTDEPFRKRSGRFSGCGDNSGGIEFIRCVCGKRFFRILHHGIGRDTTVTIR